MIAWTNGFLLTGSGGCSSIATVVVDRDPDRESQPAERHRVERRSEARETTIDDRIESGIEITTISVERQLPRKIRIMSRRQAAAMTPFTTPLIDAVTKMD